MTAAATKVVFPPYHEALVEMLIRKEYLDKDYDPTTHGLDQIEHALLVLDSMEQTFRSFTSNMCTGVKMPMPTWEWLDDGDVKISPNDQELTAAWLDVMSQMEAMKDLATRHSDLQREFQELNDLAFSLLKQYETVEEQLAKEQQIHDLLTKSTFLTFQLDRDAVSSAAVRKQKLVQLMKRLIAPAPSIGAPTSGVSRKRNKLIVFQHPPSAAVPPSSPSSSSSSSSQSLALTLANAASTVATAAAAAALPIATHAVSTVVNVTKKVLASSANTNTTIATSTTAASSTATTTTTMTSSATTTAAALATTATTATTTADTTIATATSDASVATTTTVTNPSSSFSSTDTTTTTTATMDTTSTASSSSLTSAVNEQTTATDDEATAVATNTITSTRHRLLDKVEEIKAGTYIDIFRRERNGWTSFKIVGEQTLRREKIAARKLDPPPH